MLLDLYCQIASLPLGKRKQLPPLHQLQFFTAPLSFLVTRLQPPGHSSGSHQAEQPRDSYPKALSRCYTSCGLHSNAKELPAFSKYLYCKIAYKYACYYYCLPDCLAVWLLQKNVFACIAHCSRSHLTCIIYWKVPKPQLVCV